MPENKAAEKESQRQLKNGALLSYAVIIIEIVINLLFVPWLARTLGQSSYGLYVLAISLMGMFVIDFGLTNATSKFLCKYQAEENKAMQDNFLGLIYKFYLIVDSVIFVVILVLFFFLSFIYHGLLPSELETFKTLYIIVGAYSVISLPFVTLSSVFTANEKFIAMQLITLFQKVSTVILMSLALIFNLGLYMVVLVNVSMSLVAMLIQIIFLSNKCKMKINFKYFDKALAKEVFSYTIWIAVIIVAQRISINMMPTVLGVVSNAVSIAILGFAVTIATYAFSLSNVLSTMFLPKVTRLMHKNNDSKSVFPLMLKAGRYQLFVIGLIFIGFVIFGKEFTTMLMGNDYEISYICALLIMFPYLFDIPKSTADVSSWVANTMKDIALIFIVVSVVSFGISFITGFYFGAIGVAATMGICLVLIGVFKDVFVFWKKQKLDMLGFYLKTHVRYALPAAIMVAFGFGVKYFFPITGWLWLISEVIIFTLIYAIIMYFVYFTKTDHAFFKSLLVKATKKELSDDLKQINGKKDE